MRRRSDGRRSALDQSLVLEEEEKESDLVIYIAGWRFFLGLSSLWCNLLKLRKSSITAIVNNYR